jgi:uncharacterized membrane protein
MSATPSPASPPTKRLRKRFLIPGIVIGVLVLILLGLYIRGTWADDVAHNPKSSAEGARVELYLAPDGNKQVRCAAVLDFPPGEVWAVVKDHANHDQVFRYVKSVKVEHEPDGRMHLIGTVHSRLWGDWPYDVHVRHQEDRDKNEYTDSWDEAGADMLNRGSWRVTPLEGGKKTLLVYTVQVELRRYPDFIIRNILLDRIGSVVPDIRAAIERKRAEPKS